MEKIIAQSIVQESMKIEESICNLLEFYHSIEDGDIKTNFRETISMLATYNTDLVFLVEKIYPDLNPDL